jgi:hypothetical protein
MKYLKIYSVLFFSICCLQIGYCQINSDKINSNSDTTIVSVEKIVGNYLQEGSIDNKILSFKVFKNHSNLSGKLIVNNKSFRGLLILNQQNEITSLIFNFYCFKNRKKFLMIQFNSTDESQSMTIVNQEYNQIFKPDFDMKYINLYKK